MDEYIKKDRAIELIDEIFDSTEPTGIEQVGVLKCRRAIRKEQPASDVVEVRHGKWILENDLGNGMADYKCSVCDYDDTFCISLIQRNFYKYCTNCGAKMDGKVGYVGLGETE